MPTEGFHHNGRIVYSIRYTLESPPPTIAELVVPLDSDGNDLGGRVERTRRSSVAFRVTCDTAS